MTVSRFISCVLCPVILVISVSCSENKAENRDNPVLVKVGASSLTLSELRKDLPVAMTTADSAAFASAYIRRWIDARIVSDIAASEIDMTDIDRLVNDYRNRLIEMEYRRRMADSHVAVAIPDDSLRNYFVEHNDDFKLERPMIQGVYLKVPDNAPNLAVIKRLYRSDKQDDIDRLEKEVLTSAIHYDYFRDKWVDWESIELHIPYDFGANPDAFLKGKDHFETSAGGFVYLLDITDVLQSGAYMPFDNAKALIAERLSAQQRQAYDASLMKNLYEKSFKDGKIQLFVDLKP